MLKREKISMKEIRIEKLSKSHIEKIKGFNLMKKN